MPYWDSGVVEVYQFVVLMLLQCFQLARTAPMFPQEQHLEMGTLLPQALQKPRVLFSHSLPLPPPPRLLPPLPLRLHIKVHHATNQQLETRHGNPSKTTAEI